jgi:integrase
VIGLLGIGGFVVGVILAWGLPSSSTALLVVSAVLLLFAAVGLDWDEMLASWGSGSVRLRRGLEDVDERISEVAARKEAEPIRAELESLRAEMRALTPAPRPRLRTANWNVLIEEFSRPRATHAFRDGAVRLSLRTSRRVLSFRCSVKTRPWVEPEQLMALLDATKGVGRVLLSLLAGGGLRIGEALALRWRDVDTGTGTLHVRDAKTAKGVREVHLSPALREILTIWRADAKYADSSDYLIHTSTGGGCYPSNLRRDVLRPAPTKANTTLEMLGIAPISRITFHSLRRTYASLRCACGDDVRYTADQLGHEDPRFTLRVYAQATKRRDRLAKAQREPSTGRSNGQHWAPWAISKPKCCRPQQQKPRLSGAL